MEKKIISNIFLWVSDIFQISFYFSFRESLDYWLLMSIFLYLHPLQLFSSIPQSARNSICLEVSRSVSCHQHTSSKPKFTVFSTFSCVCYYWQHHTWPEAYHSCGALSVITTAFLQWNLANHWRCKNLQWFRSQLTQIKQPFPEIGTSSRIIVGG